MVTCVILLLIGLFSSYNKYILGTALVTGAIGLLGQAGFILVKLAILFTLGCIFYNEDTEKKINQLKTDSEFREISGDIEGAIKFRENSEASLKKFKEWVKNIFFRSVNAVSNYSPKCEFFINDIKNTSLYLYNKTGIIADNIIDDAKIIHEELYKTQYIPYVVVSNYTHQGYLMLKMAYLVFTAKNMLDQFEHLDNKLGGVIDKGGEKEPTPEEAEKMLQELTGALDGLMGGMQGMGMFNQNMMGGMGMSQPNVKGKKGKRNMNEIHQNPDDIFFQQL
jgi:hypothetical protein